MLSLLNLEGRNGQILVAQNKQGPFSIYMAIYMFNILWVCTLFIIKFRDCVVLARFCLAVCEEEPDSRRGERYARHCLILLVMLFVYYLTNF